MDFVRSNIQLINPLPNQAEPNLETPIDFTTAFARAFAEQCTEILLARLPKPTVIQPRYLTVQQAADYIGHSKKSFQYLMSKKMFPVIRRDRLVLIDKNDLDAFMAREKR